MLTADQARFVLAALAQFYGPVEPTARLLAYLGMANSDEFYGAVARLEDSISTQRKLDKGALKTAVMITEVVFVSDFNGAGVEWETVSGYSDVQSIAMLRSIQRHVA